MGMQAPVPQFLLDADVAGGLSPFCNFIVTREPSVFFNHLL